MVYIDPAGKIHEEGKPWGVSRLMDLLWAPINLAVYFVQTLINPALNNAEGRYSLGGSNVGGSSSAPRRPPSRSQNSRFRTMSQFAPPPPPSSCRSCMM